MKTIQYLTDPDLAPLYWPGVIAAIGVAVVCSVLSVLVVLKRLAFIGQGVSHAAFGGVGVAFVLGVTGVAGAAAGAGEALAADLSLLSIVLAFCIASALFIARLGRAGAEADTAIGIVLVGAMALGSVLLESAAKSAGRRGEPPPPSIDGVLFGSFSSVAWSSAALAWVVAVGVLGALWWTRRTLLFWAFDSAVAEAHGINTRRLSTLLMVLLSIAIVITMRLAGVILATALLVLPGAAALRLSVRFKPVLLISVVLGLVGVCGGLVLCFETNAQPGPCIVGVQTLILVVAWAVGRRLS